MTPAQLAVLTDTELRRLRELTESQLHYYEAAEAPQWTLETSARSSCYHTRALLEGERARRELFTLIPQRKAA